MNRAWLSPAALAAIRTDAAASHPLETGGLLLGWDSPTGDVYIAETVGPGPGAVHRPTGFLPDHDWQTEQLAARYRASGRLHAYLGDWHTHPNGTGTPSRRDRTTAAAIASSKAARAPRPLMAILADDAEGTLHLWRHERRWRPLARMTVRITGTSPAPRSTGMPDDRR